MGGGLELHEKGVQKVVKIQTTSAPQSPSPTSIKKLVTYTLTIKNALSLLGTEGLSKETAPRRRGRTKGVKEKISELNIIETSNGLIRSQT